MAKYNLLEDDDIFDEDDDLTENDPIAGSDEPLPDSSISDDIDIEIDEDLLNIEPTDELDDQGFEEEPAIDNLQEDIAAELDPDPQEIEPEIKEEKPVEADKPFLTDDFEDDKQSGINYKPIVMIGSVIIILILIYVVVDTWVLSDSSQPVADTEQAAEPTKESAAEKKAALEKEQKVAFLSKIAGKTSADIAVVNNAVKNAQTSAKLSSLLLYGESFLFEVFGSDRNEIARVNMSLKSNMSGNNFSVISSQRRPGANGGVFGLFKGSLSSSGGNTGGKNVQISFNSINDFEKWLKNTSSSNSLKIKSLSNKYVKEESKFRKFELETTLTGSLDACKAFLKKLSGNGSQVNIRKLNLIASDQKSFQSKKYQLKLILEIFV
jgi:hypothetical protein